MIIAYAQKALTILVFLSLLAVIDGFYYGLATAAESRGVTIMCIGAAIASTLIMLKLALGEFE